MKLEESLNGGYGGLYGEVVDYDTYRLRDVDDIVSINDPTFVHVKGHKGITFIPDIIMDLGANVGIFSRYARSLFPDALIIAVEPDENNCKVFREFTNDPKIILHQKAIGQGKVFRCNDALNGAMESYISESLPFTVEHIKSIATETNISTIMLSDLAHYVKPGDKGVLKIDIEGSETMLFQHKPSMDVIKSFDYVIMELHYFASDYDKVLSVTEITLNMCEELRLTHDVSLEEHGVYLYAKKR